MQNHAKRTPPQKLFDGWARGYDGALKQYGYAAPRAIFDAAAPHIRPRGNAAPLRLLDIGIGTGLTSAPFRAAGGFHICGIDLSANMLARCRAAGVADELFQLNAARDDFPFVQNSFDVVIAGGVLEFIEDLAGLGIEVARVLSPGGIFVMTHELPQNKTIYRPNFFEGVLAEDEDKVTIQRRVPRRLWPQLYKKYLHSTESIQAMLTRDRIRPLSQTAFTAYRWGEGQEIVYGLFVGRK